MKLENQIPMLPTTGTYYSANSIIDFSQVSIDTADFNGVTWYFESYLYNAAGNPGNSIQLRDETNTVISTITSGAGLYKFIVRSSPISLTPGKHTYHIFCPTKTGTGLFYFSNPRIIALQSGATKTAIYLPLISKIPGKFYINHPNSGFSYTQSTSYTPNLSSSDLRWHPQPYDPANYSSVSSVVFQSWHQSYGSATASVRLTTIEAGTTIAEHTTTSTSSYDLNETDVTGSVGAGSTYIAQWKTSSGSAYAFGGNAYLVIKLTSLNRARLVYPMTEGFITHGSGSGYSVPQTEFNIINANFSNPIFRAQTYWDISAGTFCSGRIVQMAGYPFSTVYTGISSTGVSEMITTSPFTLPDGKIMGDTTRNGLGGLSGIDLLIDVSAAISGPLPMFLK